ncbi:hypothetical protein [Miltoncostaea oceani]|uniref:hypothetical protein n=1 Tax=Miltoncostaea oceani TaxID=2843216 RepID=UPI001C3E7689|nr:hypothetical protein [Miltoncostaea oceani]
MAYSITPDGDLVETVCVRTDWRCPCGEQAVSRRELPRRAGSVSMAVLMACCLEEARRICECGAPLDHGTGRTQAIYQLPGRAPVLSAVLRGRPGVARYADYLVSSSRDEAEALGGTPLPSGASDYELAHRAGKPASIDAAWQDAVVMHRLGAGGLISFPCGPGVALIAASDPRRACAAAEVLGLPSPACLDGAVGVGAPALWLSVDVPAITSELAVAASYCGVRIEEDRGRLRLWFRNRRVHEHIDVRALVENGVRASRDPVLESIRWFLDARPALERRERETRHR